MKGTDSTLCIILLAMLITASSAGPAAPANDAGGPKIEIAQPHYEFPTVAEGQTVTHDFIVHSTGGVPLKILEVKTD